MAKTEFPERASPDNPDGYLIIQRNLEFLRDAFDSKFSGAPAVAGSRGGNAALTSLLTQLDAIGLIQDNTTP